MADVTCVRCGQTRDRMAFKPFSTPLGQRVFDSICSVCWGEWVKHQQALINHHGLHVQEPEHRQLLYQHLEQFLFANSPSA